MWRYALALLSTVGFAGGLVGCSERGKPSSNDEASSPSTPKALETRVTESPPPPVDVSLGDPPRRSASADEVKAGIKMLSANVKEGASEVGNPWALAHGLVAFGADLKASDGRLAVDAIVEDHLDSRKVGRRTIRYFHPKSKTGDPVEPHPFMIANAFAHVGVPLERKFRYADGSITMKQLVEDARWMFVLPESELRWRDVGWSLSLLATLPPEDGHVLTRKGPLSIKQIAKAAVRRLEAEQAFLRPFKAKNRPDLVQKRRQGVYGHSCGGMHFVQGAVHLAASQPHLKRRLQTQLDLTRFRWSAERRIYRQVMNAQPKYRPIILIQELKFFGHLLETMAFAVKWGVIEADDELKAEMRMVAGDLLNTVRALQPFYGRLPSIRNANKQSYFDLIGDGCHAVRGLRESLVAFY